MPDRVTFVTMKMYFTTAGSRARGLGGMGPFCESKMTRTSEPILPVGSLTILHRDLASRLYRPRYKARFRRLSFKYSSQLSSEVTSGESDGFKAIREVALNRMGWRN